MLVRENKILPKEMNISPEPLEGKGFCTFLCGYSPEISPSISQPFIMIYDALTVSGCESCW